MNGNTKIESLRGPAISPTTTYPDQYDFENRLNRRQNASKLVELFYDGDGNRVKKVVTAGNLVTTTKYLVDDRNPTGYAQVVEEFTTVHLSGTLTVSTNRMYVYGHDLLLQHWNNGSGDRLVYYGYDGQGSVRFLLAHDSAQAQTTLADTYTYDAFGILIVPTGPTVNDYRYAGEQWDQDLGLSYNRARYLNLNTGRFWTMDTWAGIRGDPLSLHKYLYCHADPLNRFDATGHESLVSVNAASSIIAGLLTHELHGANAALRGAQTLFGAGDEQTQTLLYALDVTEKVTDTVGKIQGGVALGALGYKAVRNGIPAIIRGGMKFAKYLRRLIKETNDRKVILLGLDSHLNDWPETVNWKLWIKEGDPEALSKWQKIFDGIMADKNNKFVFVLDDVEVWAGVQRAASGHNVKATDWELLVIKENPQWWDRIVWTSEGKPTANPFQR